MNPDEVLDSILPEWLEAVLKESEKERQEENDSPIFLLDLINRQNIWNACSDLKVNTKGIPGAACRIMETYLVRHIEKFAGTEQWEHMQDVMIDRFYLLLASSVQLAAKMTGTNLCIGVTDVQKMLQNRGHFYTQKEIRKVEIHVFQTIGFRVPMWTNVETAEFLAKIIDVKDQDVMSAVNLITNIADLCRNSLEQHVHGLNEKNPPSNRTYKYLVEKTISHIHLCAGAVVTTLRYMSVPDDDNITRLATLTQTTVTYLEKISEGIMKELLPLNI